MADESDESGALRESDRSDRVPARAGEAGWNSSTAAVLTAAGLCGGCLHVVVRPTNKGTTYLRCGRAATDPAYPRYPRLPVLACPGFEPAAR